MKALPVAVMLVLLLAGTAHAWNSFRGDPLNTGKAPFEAGDDLTVYWEHQAGSAATSSVSAGSGMVVYGTKDGTIECLDRVNGTLRWANSTGSRVRSTPCIAGDLVVFCNDQGRIGALHASDGSPAWVNAPIGAEVLSSPKVVEGRIYVGTYGSELLCLGLDDGSVLWRYNGTRNWIHTTPCVWDGRVYFGSCDGTFYCLDATDGRLLWTFNATYIPSSPAIMSGLVYFGAYDSTFYCLNATTGRMVFGTEVGGDVYSSPAVDETGAYVGCDDGSIYCIDPYNGNVLWNASSAGSSLQSSPALAGDLVAFCDQEGLKVLSSEDGRPNASFRFGDASDCSPAVDGNLIIWADSFGLVRAAGPHSAPRDHADGRDGPMASILFALLGLNAVFFAVILIALRRMRKAYKRTRGLGMGTEHKGGR